MATTFTPYHIADGDKGATVANGVNNNFDTLNANINAEVQARSEACTQLREDFQEQAEQADDTYFSGVSVSATASAVTLNFDTVRTQGAQDIALPAATPSRAGLMTAADKKKLDGAADFEECYATYFQMATFTRTADDATIVISTDDLADNAATLTIPAATNALAGLMLPADKQAIAEAPDAGKEAALVEIYRQAFCRGRVFQATYNAQTKLWTMHGITDITTAQMGVIYRALQNSPQVGSSDFSYEFTAATEARTLPALTRQQQGYIGASYNVACVAAYSDAKAATVLRPFVNNGNHITDAKNMFRKCTVLRVILDAAGGTTGYDGTTPNGLDLSPIEANSGTQTMFDSASSTGVVSVGCPALEEVRIRGLRVSLLIASPVLSYDSLKYLADNAGTAITGATLTLHPDVINRFRTGDGQHTLVDYGDILDTLVEKGFSVAEAILAS